MSTLQSVFLQTFRDFEVIVINDGSPDTLSLEKVIQPYRDRILYLKQENRGLAGARNTGIRHARGEYLAFLDSDDAWESEYLREQFHVLQADPLLDLVYCDTRHFGRSDRAGKTFMELFPQESVVTFEGLISGRCCIIPSCAVARTRAVVEAGSFDERFFRVEDWDLWLRMAHRGARMVPQKPVLARRRVHEQALTSDGQKMAEDQVRVLRKLMTSLALDSRPRALMEDLIMRREADVFTVRGKQLLAAGDDGAAREFFEKARMLVIRTQLERRHRRFVQGLLKQWTRELKLWLVITALRVAPSTALVALRRVRRSEVRISR